MNKSLTFLMFSFFILSPAARTEVPLVNEIEIVFDASGSMNEAPRGISKLEEAKQALSTVTAQMDASDKVGLRVFGSTPISGNIRESCSDSQLLLPIAQLDGAKMTQQVQPLKSYGMTALGFSLEKAGHDFTQDSSVKKTIILISDGEETCGQDPVAVIDALKQQGIEVTIHAIGFDASDAAKGQLKKLGDMTGGSYREASNASELKESLTQVVEQTKLLTVGRSNEESILAASAGTTIVSSSTQDFAKTIDGNEQEGFALYPGQEVVFAFKDSQPVLLEKFAVPVFEQVGYNPKEMTLLGSIESPEKGFFPIRKINVENKVFFGNVYQEFKLDPPAAIKYLKVLVGAAAVESYSRNYEWKAYGKYLSETDFKSAIANLPKPEINLLAAENGGTFVAGSKPEFSRVIDGKGENPGEIATFYLNDEAIFGFEGGKVAFIKKVATPIFKAQGTNCKTFEFYASENSPGGPYNKVGTFETTNLVFAGNPYQEYVFESPVKAKFLKAKVLDTHGASWCDVPEIQAIGSLEG